VRRRVLHKRPSPACVIIAGKPQLRQLRNPLSGGPLTITASLGACFIGSRKHTDGARTRFSGYGTLLYSFPIQRVRPDAVSLSLLFSPLPATTRGKPISTPLSTAHACPFRVSAVGPVPHKNDHSHTRLCRRYRFSAAIASASSVIRTHEIVRPVHRLASNGERVPLVPLRCMCCSLYGPTLCSIL
jgi:hypothetical protein